MRQGIQLTQDRLLGNRQDLDRTSFKVEDGDGDGELDVGGAGAAAAFAGAVVAHFSDHVLVGGLEVEAEGLGRAIGSGAPGLVELKGLVGQQGKADAAAVLELGGGKVGAAGGSVDGGGGGFGQECHGFGSVGGRLKCHRV